MLEVIVDVVKKVREKETRYQELDLNQDKHHST